MNRNLKTAFIAIAVLVVIGYFYFQYTVREGVPGENQYRLANKYLEDGNKEEALKIFDGLLAKYPDYKEANLGKAITLMQMDRPEESEEFFDKAINIDSSFATAYANRGILKDRMGRYEEAIVDYRKSLELRPELAEGPGWIWRFLHNVPDKPPSIADRAKYLESELSKPESKRLLHVPEIDKKQEMYKK